MIVVVADDLSGAAEMAGLGWRFGLRTRLQNQFSLSGDVDLVVVNTRSRAMTQEAGCEQCQALAQHILQSNNKWCYKKVDSVLRGHVYAELQTVMRVLNTSRAILAPANPSQGKTIMNGQYRINGQLLDSTDYANDPESPATSSHVFELLGDEDVYPIHVVAPDQQQGCDQGILVAEAQTQQDLDQWASHVDDSTLAAGGSDFFAALLTSRLKSKTLKKQMKVIPAEAQTLIVCGSASDYSHSAVRQMADGGVPVCFMPETLFHETRLDTCLTQPWIRDVQAALCGQGLAVVAIEAPVQQDAQLAQRLRMYMTSLVQEVVKTAHLSDLIIEGGATAEAVMERLDAKCLDVQGQYQRGVVCLSPASLNGPRITIKPGNYTWPDAMLTQWSKGMSYAK